MRQLNQSAEAKKQDDDPKWKEMEKKLEKLATLVENLSITGLT